MQFKATFEKTITDFKVVCALWYGWRRKRGDLWFGLNLLWPQVQLFQKSKNFDPFDYFTNSQTELTLVQLFWVKWTPSLIIFKNNQMTARFNFQRFLLSSLSLLNSILYFRSAQLCKKSPKDVKLQRDSVKPFTVRLENPFSRFHREMFVDALGKNLLQTEAAVGSHYITSFLSRSM